MERVAFLIEATGERLSCLLNPESVTFQRSSGVRQRHDRSGIMMGAAATDDPLIATGGGVTELTLNLLFDTEVAESMTPGAQDIAAHEQPRAGLPATPATGEAAPATAPARMPLPQRSPDVRELTRPFWNLSENGTISSGTGGPPVVRFIWGRAWNVPGVIIAVAERLERFGADGAPQRSWMTLRLRRVPDSATTRAAPASPVTPQHEFPPALDPALLEQAPRVEMLADTNGRPATPLYLVADEHLGSPHAWPLIAAANNIEDPLRIEAGAVLAVPLEQNRTVTA